jgi:thioesterase domain-containing protein
MTTGQLETLLRSGLDLSFAPVFNECLVIQLPGAVDPEALDRALARVATRHPLLRGAPDAAEARWLIQMEAPRWERLKARDGDAAARLIESRASSLLAPAGSPPVRCLLVNQADGGTTLALVAHHCILDGWSATVFLRELAGCYRAETGAGDSTLPETDDIADFLAREIATERAALANPKLRAFWQTRCGNIPAMSWPGNPSPGDPAAGHARLRLPSELVERVRAAAREGGRMEFTQWLGIHLLWLHWLCRQDDLILGIPMAAQAMTGKPGLLGHGTRFLPVRSRHDANMTARDFLDALAKEMIEVIQHGQLTAGAMTPWLDRGASRADHSLLPTAFSVVPEMQSADFGGAGEGNAFVPPRAHVAMPLVGWLQSKREGLELDLAYQRAMFRSSDMEAWANAWLLIADGIAARPEVRLSELPLPEAPNRVEKKSERISPGPLFSSAWTPTSRRIAEIWSELIGQKINSPAADFFASGGHSLLALRFFSRWHRESGINAPLATLLNFPVLADLAGELDRLGEARTDATTSPILPTGLARLRAGGPASPLLFLHAGDGGVIFSRDIAGDLPARHPVYAIESPHLAGTELPEAVGVEVMAARYLDLWDSLGLATPPVLIGYSFGGVVAWEMACRMASRGKAPALVVLIDTHNPEVPLRALGLARRMGVFWRQNHHLPAGARLAAMFRRAVEGTKNHLRIRKEVRRAAVDPTGELRTVRLRELHEAAMLRYLPPDYEGAVALLKAASSGDKFELPADYHWGTRARGIFTILEVPGDHLGILDQQNLPALAACLTRLLASSLPDRV